MVKWNGHRCVIDNEERLRTIAWYERVKRLTENRGVIDNLKFNILPKEWQRSPEETGFTYLTWPTWQTAFLIRHADSRITDEIMNAVGEYMLEQEMEGLWDKGTSSKRYIMWDATAWRNLFAIFYCLFMDGRLLGRGWETLYFREGTLSNSTALISLEELFDR